MKTLKHIFDRNRAWADSINKEDPNFFPNLSKQQSPEYLWIGCSDSRVPANQIVDLPSGELFVHRNIANLVVHTDMNCLSVIQYAVEVLKVKHIIVCGHYDCGGVKAAMECCEHGFVDNWLSHIKDIIALNSDLLKDLSENDKYKRICELNTIEQVKNVSQTTMVKNAWQKGQELSVHGWIYDLHNGILKDLNICKTGIKEDS